MKTLFVYIYLKANSYRKKKAHAPARDAPTSDAPTSDAPVSNALNRDAATIDASACETLHQLPAPQFLERLLKQAG